MSKIDNDDDSILIRSTIIADSELVVIKLGTRVLTDDNGVLDEAHIATIADDICNLVKAGKRIVVVSSGAVGAGMSRLKLTRRPTDVARLQAVAAIGQAHLINVYNRTMQQRGFHAAQVLLTANDIEDRSRYLNVRNTLFAAMELGAIPIVNENDTVATDELIRTFGDNDHLAARVATLLQAELLILLSDIEGLYDAHPDQPNSKLIDTVTELDEKVMQYVNDSANQLSRGGMASKIEAARAITAAGDNMIIAKGKRPGILQEIFAGKQVGTLFLAKDKLVSPRKRWLGFGLHSQGRILLDDGAVSAIRDSGSSLLPIGICGVEGDFVSGDGISLCDANGSEFARGLTNYGSIDVKRIMGRQSEQIAELLGSANYKEVVHRNNLALL